LFFALTVDLIQLLPESFLGAFIGGVEKEAENILRVFEHNKTVRIQFSFTYGHDEHERNTRNMTVAERGTAHQTYVTKNIIEPIGGQDILYWKKDVTPLEYIAEVTKAGYEKLKNHKNVRWIYLIK